MISLSLLYRLAPAKTLRYYSYTGKRAKLASLILLDGTILSGLAFTLILYYNLRSISPSALLRLSPHLDKYLGWLINLALRKILGTFQTSPIQAIEVKASLLPPVIRLDIATYKYAFQLAKLSLDHLVNRQIAKSSYLGYRL
ncbi:hypothetical protein LHYA1_G009170 [Lachnellula hyalina]|uniref:Uncharacterized protein n=1 Tax=Lachnellula hyalina TaxID=1316788 RepID=A0A8H8QUX5_9HELO|nr:uncharacterized protein LHYA1_G009170 [Lachnellula hyalina]TVY22140.1 hypothetical protein LHYA1_G009170 [Lachnellula hyalina]